jgi:hypothetical protein
MNPLPQIRRHSRTTVGANSFAKALFRPPAMCWMYWPLRGRIRSHRSDDIHALLWERIHSRKLDSGRRQCVGCTGPFADESVPTDIDDMHALLLWERIHSRKLFRTPPMCWMYWPFADEPAPADPTIFTHYCGSEFIRESYSGRRQCVGCTGPFADEAAVR